MTTATGPLSSRGSALHAIPFDALGRADLIIDAVYEGGSSGHVGDDALDPLLRVGNQGGIRYRGRPGRDLRLVVLYTDLSEPDWPDELDAELGRLIYYGDNRHAGRALHDTQRRGNLVLRETFQALHATPPSREAIAPHFVFFKAGHGRDVVFKGLAVPGAPGVAAVDDLVAVWRSSTGLRFQNYRAVFTILDVPVVSRAWVEEVLAGRSDGPAAPSAWLEWQKKGRYRPLAAPSSLPSRTRDQQLPDTPAGRAVIDTIIDHFSDLYVFERCAAELWRMHAQRVEYTVTRRSRDGGRDAVGYLRIGPAADPVELDFTLEAKRYAMNKGVGVKEVARLIPRIRHRMFGVLVTTSYVDRQAYEELRADGHPVVVMAARDIVELLRERGYATPDAVRAWLVAEFPRDAS